MKVGLLALQGAVQPHADAMALLGHPVREVRTPSDLDVVDALIVPGGESTTVSKLLGSSRLTGPLVARLGEGMPVLGTCAGLILLSRRVVDGREDQMTLGAIDLSVRRNGFGRQVDSFEIDLTVTHLDRPFPAVFIRAPVVEGVGDEVEILASVSGHPVLCRHRNVMVSAFHPELVPDTRIHGLWLDTST